MKLLIILLSLISVAIAAPSVHLDTQCFKMKDSLDRDYCQKKKAKLIENKYNAEEKTWSNGLQAAAKTQKTNIINARILEKEEELNFAQKELELLKNHKARLAKVKVVTPKKKKKKKKKKNPLDQLGIKL
jgi:uncharacterized protein with FMN-binding domain